MVIWNFLYLIQSLKLNILSERKLCKALNEFVMKDEKDAIPELVKWQLKKTQKVLRERNLDETSIHDAILSVKVTEDQVPEQEEDEEIERVCFYFKLIKHWTEP